MEIDRIRMYPVYDPEVFIQPRVFRFTPEQVERGDYDILNPDRYDFSWSSDFTEGVAALRAYWDDASYARWQSDFNPQGDYEDYGYGYDEPLEDPAVKSLIDSGSYFDTTTEDIQCS